MNLGIAWFFGFGWPTILIFVACGIGINQLQGPVVWVLYLPLLIVAIYMTVRFRLYSMHPWRRAHSRAMLEFSKMAEKEYDEAKRQGREYDIAAPCRELARSMFGQDDTAARLLTEDGRKTYYKELVKEFPQIFLKGFSPERQDRVIDEIYRDIDTSALGPDILIARDIELRYSRGEAAVYLQSLMLGAVR